ncbi:GMC oxidoreductase [Cohnella sp. CFH 77786]|uniref:GMC oxidoreductase n=1 Tax=Cohnella sp. CFH 77786 TaxID=2662265 RepID=UPI002103F487|nr:GMC family oxidoreductase [Cohnella sp. CFH 77786]
MTPIEKMAQTDYDALIVGSGAGGSAVLWRLSEQWAASGKRIGIIESGPLLLPTHGRNLPTMDQERFVRFFDNPLHTEYIGKQWPEYPGAKIIRALGGRTLQWNLVSPRLSPVQFKSWPISYREMVRYYLLAEEMMSVTTDYAKGSSIQQTLLKRLRAQGLADAQALPLSADLQASQFGIIHSNVFTSSINFFAAALNIRPFDLAVHVRANQVLIDKGRAAGVKVMTPDRKSYTIAAKTVILSAGTWETPRLLLHSGIPGKAIGHYLVNHPKLIAIARGSRDQFGEVSGVASLMVPHPENSRILVTGIGPDPEQYYWYAYEEKPYLNELRFRFYCQGTMEPQFDNHVYLVPGTEDEYGVPRLQVKFTYGNEDRVTIGKQFKFLEKAVASMGLELESAPRLLPPGEDNHECGTCRMGVDPDTSATDAFGRIHGISGLFVADNSVVRLSGPAHPTLTTVALAIRTADYISGQAQS